MEIPADLSLVQVKKYLDKRVAELDSVFRSLENQDCAALREILHRWKGNAELYGFGELGILSGKVVRILDTSPVQWTKVSDEVGSIAEKIHSEARELVVLMRSQ